MKSYLLALGSGTFLTCCIFFLNNCPNSSQKSVPKLHTVEIKAMQFQPVELSVQKGDTVVFVNRDIVVHDVTEEKHKAWSSSPLETGQSYSKVITESFAYYCSIHPVMKGKIRVP